MDCLNQSQQVGALSSAVFSDRHHLHQQVAILPWTAHHGRLHVAHQVMAAAISDLFQIPSSSASVYCIMSLLVARRLSCAQLQLLEQTRLHACAASAAAIKRHRTCILLKFRAANVCG